VIDLPVSKTIHKAVQELMTGEKIQLKVHLHGRPRTVAVVSGALKALTCKVHYPETKSDRKGVKTVTTEVILERK
jgi:hypothetical protein